MGPAVGTTVLALLLAVAAASEAENSAFRPQQSLDLLRLLMEKPWIGMGPHHRWDRPPRIEVDPDDRNYADDVIRSASEKRSAVATALNAGRRRRQPAPALGKAVTPYVGVGVLNDMGTFFDSLRDNLETLASLSPEQRSTLFQEPPTVVHAPSSGVIDDK
ncbi:uncharacterized protein LOC113238339 [Hyposmocoma kahamanoa]|uniref:uncharacterized protein LOC113238339 n=1 Tax=Hyposmocoma kahamanoa TaxID=1477025 RepID=UPI000E6D751F|nr:uncharacterized protein LOC113238339 [Hyposmocoma kahamanoa]